MRFIPVFLCGVWLVSSPAFAQDTLTPAVLEATKKASVFIRLNARGEESTGSGFVAQVDGDRALIVTNHHVATPSEPTPPGQKLPTLTVYFESGTPGERSFPAEIVAVDRARDLAILRIRGVKNLPSPIPFDPAAPLSELMTVYSFGYPFGDVLSMTRRGSPAVTVGKASVSSLRLGDDGELAMVQIDGALNPGNSGGPIINAQGRLAGVAVATIKQSSGIGLIIPGGEVLRMMNGRTGAARMSVERSPDGQATVRYEADLLDPLNLVRGGTLHYLLVPEGAEKVRGSLSRAAGCKNVPLRIERGKATCEFSVAKAEGDVQVQAVTEHEAGRGQSQASTASFTLAPPPLPAAEGGKPPVNWKEYIVKDRSFGVWLPGGARGSELEREIGMAGQKLRVGGVKVEIPGGLNASGMVLILPAAVGRLPRNELLDMMKDRESKRGQVLAQKDVTMGGIPGTEFLVEDGKDTSRTRIFVNGSRLYRVDVTGTDEQIESRTADTFLNSLHIPANTGSAVIASPGTGMPRSTGPARSFGSRGAEIARFDGRWQVASQMLDGKEAATEHGSEILVFRNGEFWFEGRPDRGRIVRVDPGRTPATVDYLFTEGPMKGKTQQGIYLIDDNALIGCTPSEGRPRPESFEEPGSGTRVIRYARMGPAPVGP